MSAETRKAAVEKAGLTEVSLAGRGCHEKGIIRNGEIVQTLGRLVERDAEVEAKGLYRAPHGVEADILFESESEETDAIAAEIAAERAASNGRNVFWEGGPGGAASFPSELATLGPRAARRAAMDRAALWRALPECAQPHEFWAWCVTPDEFWSKRAKELAYTVWGYPDWYASAVKSGLRDFALEQFRKYGLCPRFGRGSEFWRTEGVNAKRRFVWALWQGGRVERYLETDTDCPPSEPGEWLEAGLTLMEVP